MLGIKTTVYSWLKHMCQETIWALNLVPWPWISIDIFFSLDFLVAKKYWCILLFWQEIFLQEKKLNCGFRDQVTSAFQVWLQKPIKRKMWDRFTTYLMERLSWAGKWTFHLWPTPGPAISGDKSNYNLSFHRKVKSRLLAYCQTTLSTSSAKIVLYVRHSWLHNFFFGWLI